MPKLSKKKKTKKSDEPRHFRIDWLLASEFLLRGFTLVKVETRGKKMTAVLLAKS